jgi:hypothetical protein
MTEFKVAVSEEVKYWPSLKFIKSYEIEWPVEFIGPSKS